MKQAIEEGFIKDVLLNYTTYQSFYALLKKIEDDPEYDKKMAQKKLKAYVEGHDHAIKKKSILMIDHFMDKVVKKKKMGNKAKAMMITSSRAKAVQYKHAFDAYLKSINSPYEAIVGFSGEGYARFFNGKVVDMLYFPIWTGQFPNDFPIWANEYFVFFRPVFNLADTAITVGVLNIILFQRSFFAADEPEDKPLDSTKINEAIQIETVQ